MASFTGHLAWQFLRGRYLDKIGAALGRPLSDAERQAFAEDAHGGWWETSLMLLVRPDLVDGAYRTLPPARYPLAARVLPNYPLRNGGLGYVGHPALAVLRAPALSHRLLAPRDDGAGADRSGGDRLAMEENREMNGAESHLVSGHPRSAPASRPPLQ